jgi:hypothetical protein
VAGLLPVLLISWGCHRLLVQFGARATREILSLGLGLSVSLVAGYFLLSYGGLLSDPNPVYRFASAFTELPDRLTPEIFILSAGLLLWGMGRRLGGLNADFPTMVQELQFGLSVMLIVFLIHSQIDAAALSAVPATLSFFFFALFALAAAHGREKKGWLYGNDSSRWAVLLIACIAGILAFGVIIGTVINPDLMNLLISALARAVETVIALLLKLLRFLADLFPSAAPQPIKIEPPGGGAGNMPPEWPVYEFFSETVKMVLRFILAATWLTLFIVALWRICASLLNWICSMLGDPEGAETEQLSGAFLDDLSFLFRKFRDLPRRIYMLLARFMNKNFQVEAVSVRQIYRKLLSWASGNGCPRRASQTPYEYLENLVKWLPEAAVPLERITRGYVSVRYGGAGTEAGELERIGESLKEAMRLRAEREKERKRLQKKRLFRAFRRSGA